MRGPLGGLVDACCVIALVAGTVGPIGFLATQVSFGLHELFGLPEGYTGQLMILAVLGTIYVLSSMSGVHKGIQLLSRFNVLLALAIGAVIIMFGPTLFLVNTYVSSMGAYVSEFFRLCTADGDFCGAHFTGPQHSRNDSGGCRTRPDCHYRMVYATGRLRHLLSVDRGN